MTTDTVRRAPKGAPTGGQFATQPLGRAQVTLAGADPYVGTAATIGRRAAGRPTFSAAALAEEIYGELMRSWDGPPVSEEARVEALRTGQQAAVGLDGGAAGEAAYQAMRPVLDAVRAGTYQPSPTIAGLAAREVVTRRIVAGLFTPRTRPVAARP